MSSSKIDKQLQNAARKSFNEYEVVRAYVNLFVFISFALALYCIDCYLKHAKVTDSVLALGGLALIFVIFTLLLVNTKNEMLAPSEVILKASKVEWCGNALRLFQQKLLKDGNIRLRDLKKVFSLQRKNELLLCEQLNAEQIKVETGTLLSRKTN